MAFLNRELLLKKEELKIQKVDLGNGDFVFVRQMSGREKDRFEQSLIRKVYDRSGKLDRIEQDLENFRAKLAVFTLCDEQGNLILQPNDYETLANSISASKLEKIVEASTNLNQVSESAKVDVVKNFEVGPVEGLPSA